MIVLISLPILGLLMMYHEYGSPGSAYPRTAPYLETDPDGSTTDMIRNRKIPLVQHIGRSLYMAVLSFFQESYDQSVVTTGGKIHLLAISSLVYLVLAVYVSALFDIRTIAVSKVVPGVRIVFISHKFPFVPPPLNRPPT